MANLKDLIVNGTARIIGKVYASEFVGNLDGHATSSSSLISNGSLDTQEKIDKFIEANKLKFAQFQGTNNTGVDSGDGILVSIPWTSTDFGFQMAFDDTTAGTIKVRGRSGGSWGGWKKVWVEGDNVTDSNGNPYVTSNTFAETIGNINSALDTINGEVV